MGAPEQTLALVPLAGSEALDWAPVPVAGYMADPASTNPMGCRIDLLHGTPLSGPIARFDPDARLISLTIEGMRKPMSVAFSAIRSIELATPLIAAHADIRPTLTPPRPYSVIYRDGSKAEGEANVVVEQSRGVFLFCLDDTGALRRSFIPSVAYSEFRVHELQAQTVTSTLPLVDDDFVFDTQVKTPAALWKALDDAANRPQLRLGEYLRGNGMINEAQLTAALKAQKSSRMPLGQLLLEQGVIDEMTLQMSLASTLGMPTVEIEHFEIEPGALLLVPQPMADRLKVVPLCERDGALAVALEDPWRTPALDELKFITQRKIRPVLAPMHSIEPALRRLYRAPGDADAPIEFEHTDVNDLAEQLAAEESSGSTEVEGKAISESDTALTRLVNTMILDAYSQGASDIHIENYPGNQKTRIRFRKDGELHAYLELPSNYRRALVARLKIMATLDISERRKPQDGKIDFSRFGPAKIELRVATIPTNNGLEDVVMRILASAKPVPLEKLGLGVEVRHDIERIANRPYGLFLVCGPTGSGKTTTLHSCLAHINTPSRKIWTAEDPVEITQAGLRQVQVNPKIGWNFSDALRAFLRADPDVIMIGEMRDLETSRIAIEASLTGHLVMSTLHTNSAPESIVRLLDMGLDPFNFADALLGVLAQRLVRKLCSECRAPVPATDEQIDNLLTDYCRNAEDPAQFRTETLARWKSRFADENGRLRHWKTPGCPKCNGTGYKGRAGIHELLSGTPEIRHLLQTGARVDELAKMAMKQGMRTLRQDGIEKVLQGISDIAEVRSASN
mgnify:FL=1